MKEGRKGREEKIFPEEGLERWVSKVLTLQALELESGP